MARGDCDVLPARVLRTFAHCCQRLADMSNIIDGDVETKSGRLIGNHLHGPRGAILPLGDSMEVD